MLREQRRRIQILRSLPIIKSDLNGELRIIGLGNGIKQRHMLSKGAGGYAVGVVRLRHHLVICKHSAMGRVAHQRLPLPCWAAIFNGSAISWPVALPAGFARVRSSVASAVRTSLNR